MRHLLEILLHYLQIDALCTRAVAAVLAENMCDRQLDWQSDALPCARFANTQLSMDAGVVYTVASSSDDQVTTVAVCRIVATSGITHRHAPPYLAEHANAPFRK